jgi:hypothetical protein
MGWKLTWTAGSGLPSSVTWPDTGATLELEQPVVSSRKLDFRFGTETVVCVRRRLRLRAKRFLAKRYVPCLVFAAQVIVVLAVLQGVAFAAGGFEIEHQVLHIEPQLAQGFLDEVENPAAALGAIDDPVHERFQPRAMLGGKGRDSSREVGDVFGEFFGWGGDAGLGHCGDVLDAVCSGLVSVQMHDSCHQGFIFTERRSANQVVAMTWARPRVVIPAEPRCCHATSLALATARKS